MSKFKNSAVKREIVDNIYVTNHIEKKWFKHILDSPDKG